MTRMAILSKWEHPCKMANIITGIRIVCSIALLFCPLFSQAFYALYITAGISDMIDGTIARKTGTVSELGAKLDTAADFVLVVVCLSRMIPALHIPMWLVIWIIMIAAIRAINLVYGYVMRKELVVLHTVMNKVTGILLYRFIQFPPIPQQFVFSLQPCPQNGRMCTVPLSFCDGSAAGNLEQERSV